MPNIKHYGFRLWQPPPGTCQPNPIERQVATAYQAQDDGSGFSVDINVGDPLKMIAGGLVQLANTTDLPDFICDGVVQYYDGTAIRRPAGNRLPGGTAYGTNFTRRSILRVIPTPGCRWRVCVNDAVSATTEAAYNALVGKNVIHVCTGVSALAAADPLIDISETAANDQLEWRIVEIPPGQDFAAANVEIIVEVNATRHAGWPNSLADANVVEGI